jgi:hypothetical protein
LNALITTFTSEEFPILESGFVFGVHQNEVACTRNVVGRLGACFVYDYLRYKIPVPRSSTVTHVSV